MPDHIDFESAVRDAFTATPFRELLADAGYDSEAAHRFVREELGAKSIIPPNAGRPTLAPPTGRYRYAMAKSFPHKRYGPRWHIETTYSQDKRRFGSQVAATSVLTQKRELLLRALVHNIALVLSCPYENHIAA